MESQYNQLRFDISEKVRLHPQQMRISTLLELDLYPDVEIRDEGQHLKIQGYLRLNGAYLGETDESYQDEQVQVHTDLDSEAHRQELAYVIPVEITLPADRAELNQISAEVESFDYQVLSPFELQIEAILMIDGLIPEQGNEDMPQLSVKEEEQEPEPDLPVFTGSPAQPLSFVNEQSNSDFQEREKETVQQETESAEAQELEHNEPIMEMHPSESPRNHNFLRVEDEALESPTRNEVFPPNPFSFTEKMMSKEKKHIFSDFQSQTPKDFWEERQETRPEVQPRENSSLQKNESVYNKAEKEDLQTPETQDKAEEEQHENDWIRWLIGSKEEKFVSMKMVIVQKDESLDTLAEKYDISAGRILRLNNLQSDGLEEGQIIYVPTTVQDRA